MKNILSRTVALAGLMAAFLSTSSTSTLGPGPTVTVFEGARVIVGDGRAPIENATFVVTGAQFTAVGRTADVRVPAGTITHIYALEDAKGTLRAGVDAFAHGVRDRDVDDELIALVKRNPNFVIGPNMPDRGEPTDLSFLRGEAPAADFDGLQASNKNNPEAHAFWSIQARNLAKMSAAGATIVLGSDGNTPYAPHIEMEDMVAAGLTPMLVIVAATRNGARFLRMNDAGTIEANKNADFLVLDASPLENITNTRKIASVYLRGAALDRAALRGGKPGTR